MLTEERVLQTQETVLLGGHFVQLTCFGDCCVKLSRSLCRGDSWDSEGGVEEVL
jgi:hypothetical protein